MQFMAGESEGERENIRTCVNAALFTIDSGELDGNTVHPDRDPEGSNNI